MALATVVLLVPVPVDLLVAGGLLAGLLVLPVALDAMAGVVGPDFVAAGDGDLATWAVSTAGGLAGAAGGAAGPGKMASVYLAATATSNGATIVANTVPATLRM